MRLHLLVMSEATPIKYHKHSYPNVQWTRIAPMNMINWVEKSLQDLKGLRPAQRTKGNWEKLGLEEVALLSLNPNWRNWEKLLADVVYWRRYATRAQALRFSNPIAPVSSLCFVVISQDMSSQLLLQCHICPPMAMFPMAVMDSNLLEL